MDFTHHDTTTVPATIRTVTDLYEASRADKLDDPFHAVDRFVDRFKGYLAAPGFEMVLASIGGQPVALAFGHPLPSNARWWTALTPPDSELTAETGTRTFAVDEVMTHPYWQRQGIGSATHTELLRSRTEERATVLVDDTNTPALAGCTKLGYRKVGNLSPFPGAPSFAAMIINLPIITETVGERIRAASNR